MPRNRWRPPPKPNRFTVLDNLAGGRLVARNISAEAAAKYLGISAQDLLAGVENFSFIDAAGYRVEESP
jgi:hypothetical protein